MSEISRGQLLDIIVRNATDNPAYRAALLKDPKAVLSKQMNTELPPTLKVKVLEETADTIYVIAPYVAPKEGDELSDTDLERVAGGKSKSGTTRKTTTATPVMTRSVSAHALKST